SVTSIGENAFYGCTSLTSITIPNSVTTIGNGAFQSCALLATVTFAPGSLVTKINDRMFSYCTNLSSISIPASVTSIGDYAFYLCTNLVTISIPALLRSIGAYAFQSCSSLASITIPASVTSIGNSAFLQCTRLTSITIPNSVTSIGNNAFYGCTSLTSITIPASVTSIGDGLFYSCTALTTATFATGSLVTKINDRMFSDCTNLSSISIPASVTSIGDYAFYLCINLVTISIPALLRSIGVNAFDVCSKLETISIPALVTSIGNRAFQDCNRLAKVAFLGNVPTLGDINVFSGIPASATAYYLSNTNSVDLAKYFSTRVYPFLSYTVTGISSTTLTGFYDVDAKYLFTGKIVIPASYTEGATTYPVTDIAANAFENCHGLTSVEISDSVTTIGANAFNGSDNLVTVIFLGGVLPALGTTAFSPVDTTSARAYVTSGVLADTSTLTPYFSQFSKYLLNNVCFPAKTPITTNQGNIPIEKLDPAVHTIRNKKILAITKTVSQEKHIICFEKDSLGENVPSQKTSISSNHEILYKGVMTKAKDFVNQNFKNVYKVKYGGEVLYNVLMEKHDKMMVNNMICETLHPESSAAKFYMILKDLKPKEQQLFIQRANEHILKNNIYSPNTVSKK
ncbi:MAG: leucine-rich repeat protein, partial [Candidatus Marinimicrobia bacterium]|nr:leucine-rich repeat protein [Candidatus Neomarinimicrobiota bacterium]